MTSELALPDLIDTHCHLVLLEQRGLLDAALESAVAAGVKTMVSVGLDLEDSERNRTMAEAHASSVVFTVGWHPHQTRPPDAAELEQLNGLLHHPQAVAVGEIGLDAYFRPGYHETPMEVQESQLHTMMELADAHKKPVVLHNRDSSTQMLAALRRWPEVRGVMHCFAEDLQFARHCLDLGYVISFSGLITFPKTDAIQETVRLLPSGSFVVETDAPYLAPVPHRGRPNLPGFVADTAAFVANLRSETEAEVRQSTTVTARKLFGLPSPPLST